METLIAIPSAYPGGSGAPLDTHFGPCDLYTLVTIENGSVTAVKPFLTCRISKAAAWYRYKF